MKYVFWLLLYIFGFWLLAAWPLLLGGDVWLPSWPGVVLLLCLLSLPRRVWLVVILTAGLFSELFVSTPFGWQLLATWLLGGTLWLLQPPADRPSILMRHLLACLAATVVYETVSHLWLGRQLPLLAVPLLLSCLLSTGLLLGIEWARGSLDERSHRRLKLRLT